MLKVDLHNHVKGDPVDWYVKHTPHQLIDKAAELGYDVLAISCHDLVYPLDELKEYAQSKNILLIPSSEKTLHGKHILLCNITPEDLQKIDSFDDIRALKKRKDVLVIAPHPFYLFSGCLEEQLEQNIDVFDGIEYAHFHYRFINLNKKAVEVAQKHNKPLVGLSDSHHLRQFGTAYSLVESEKTIPSVFAAIRAGKVKYVSPSLSLFMFLLVSWWIVSSIAARKIRTLFGIR